MDTPTKRCTKCGEEFPATAEYFSKNKMGKLGLHSICKSCRSITSREWREKHPERVKESSRRWQQANRERATAKARRWRKANPGKDAASARHRRKADPEHAKAQNSIDHSNRRARKLNAKGTHTAEDIQRQYASQEGRCWWCGKSAGDTYHADHLVPLSRGGSNAPENIVITCPSCNLSKHDKLPHEWCGRLF